MDRAERFKRYGIWPSVWRRLVQLQQPVVGFVRLRCLVLSAEKAARMTVAAKPDLVVREMPLEHMEALKDVPEELRAKDLALARREGHRCIGVFDAGRLASFSFNVPKPTRYNDALRFMFPDGWVYHWMAVTLPQWRGRGLHGLQIPAVCNTFARPAFEGIVTLVDSVNYPSLRSFARMGFEEHCTFTLLGVGAQSRVVAGPTEEFRLTEISQQPGD